MQQRATLLFQAPYVMTVTEEPIPVPTDMELLVQTSYSAISAGTELLFYRGQVPPELRVDASIAALGEATVTYPLSYGYATVGRVIAVGAALDKKAWLGRRVFAFHPHTSHFVAATNDLIAIPEHVTDEQAVFLPNMETAINFVHDGAPLLDERIAVFGQGVVGLLTVHLLARFPLASLISVDREQARHDRAQMMGATEVVANVCDCTALTEHTMDLVYELTGNPHALNDAISCTAYSGRVVVGSWYGQKRAEIDLGGHFHRNRIQLISSQVSTIAPHLQGRWDKARRFAAAWRMLATLDATTLITHRIPLEQANIAYQLLDKRPETALQIVLTY